MLDDETLDRLDSDELEILDRLETDELETELRELRELRLERLETLDDDELLLDTLELLSSASASAGSVEIGSVEIAAKPCTFHVPFYQHVITIKPGPPSPPSKAPRPDPC